jgi:hypothetical protein
MAVQVPGAFFVRATHSRRARPTPTSRKSSCSGPIKLFQDQDGAVEFFKLRVKIHKDSFDIPDAHGAAIYNVFRQIHGTHAGSGKSLSLPRSDGTRPD